MPGIKIGAVIRELEEARQKYGDDLEVVVIEVMPENKMVISFTRKTVITWPYMEEGIILAAPERSSYGKHEVKKE